ncbi:MAG TPA: hypothetical protein VL358_11190 [Caulobacteraceae bacterium]|jgi:hypothetical protein|nr:hypothetical protein [Caulobacteraceae bacterium]
MKAWKSAAGAGALLIAALAAGAASAQAVIKADGSYEYPKAEYKNAIAHYEALKAAAHGGTKKTFANLPDWTGVWTRAGGGLKFDPKQPAANITTAKLTPKYQASYEKKVAEVKAGVEWDRLSYCLPPGMPRWLTEPFLREFVVRPEQVWLIEEQVNEIRRIYTDGRGHTPTDEAYPLWEGDSIGFWDGDTLVISTTQLKDGQYQRAQPDYSDKIELVEKWRKINPTTIEDDVTIYDPEGLTEPWHVVQAYTKVTNPPDLRVRYWSCEENNNVVNQGGTTQFVLPGDPGYKDPSVFGKEPERTPGK